MANATDIKALIRQAMEKQAASVDTERSDENSEDVKSSVPASVDSQTAADAVGRMEKDPAATIGTKAESSTDEPVDGIKKDKDDDQAFKSASDLRKLAAQLTEAISKAAETAITTDAADGAASQPNTDDSEGKEEPVGDAKSDGASAQTTAGTDQSGPTKTETASKETAPEKDPADGTKTEFGKLASEIYQLANQLLDGDDGLATLCKSANIPEEEVAGDVVEEDVDNLSDEEADELAAALEASAMDAAQEGTEDADQVGDYLEAYQGAPEVLGDEGMADVAPEGEVAPEGMPGMPAGAEDAGEVDSLVQMLEEAGISPEELVAEASKSASAKKSKNGHWTKLSKEQKREVVLTAIKGLGGEQ